MSSANSSGTIIPSSTAFSDILSAQTTSSTSETSVPSYSGSSTSFADPVSPPDQDVNVDPINVSIIEPIDLG